MTKTTAKVLIVFLITMILSSCVLKKNSVQPSDKLTVMHIHDTITYGKTTKDELLKIYGNPDEQTTEQETISKLYNEDDVEGGTMDLLDDRTNYFKTERYVKNSYSEADEYDACYTYKSDSLGVKHVHFYIKGNIVSASTFGEITNERIAKQDKYLRQILD